MVSAPLKQYREEYVAGFEQRSSQLRGAVLTEAMIKGNTAEFLVASTSDKDAVTRGLNGDIPYQNVNNNQYTATLVEKHAPFEKTGFDIFGSQGDQRRVMMNGSQAVLNRDIDKVILAELGNATQNTGSAATGSLALVMKAQTILGNNDVDVDMEDDMFFVASHAFRAYLMQIASFASAEYVDVKPFSGPARKFVRWAGFNWIFSTRIAGKGTNSEACFAFHRNAIGHAIALSEENIFAGYEEKQDRSWTRATAYHGAKLIQNTGVVKVVHDGSAYVAA